MKTLAIRPLVNLLTPTLLLFFLWVFTILLSPLLRLTLRLIPQAVKAPHCARSSPFIGANHFYKSRGALVEKKPLTLSL